MNTERHYVENDIDNYYEEAVSSRGGVTRKIIYRGRKGCADHLTGFPSNRLFLVELKRPDIGAAGIKIHQKLDGEMWAHVGVEKVFLWTHQMINDWLKKVAP